MGNNVQAVKPAQQPQQPSTLKRIAYTCGGVAVPIFVLGKELAEGKNLKTATDTLKNDYKDVHKANKESIKSGLKKTADAIDGYEKFGGLFGLGIKYLNKVVNE